MKRLAVALLTMNVAGIPLVHPHWAARREALGHALSLVSFDVVAMQEVWRDGDAAELAKASRLPYYARFDTRLDIGTGLAILSRWPIALKRQLWFTCRPSKLRVYDGEPLADKGALLARLKTPAGPLDVYDTHVIAQYKIARYRTLRLTQIFELSEFVLENSTATPFALAGDLNAARDDEAYGILLDLLGLDDPCVRKGREACAQTVAEDWSGALRIDHVLLPAGGKADATTVSFPPLATGEPLSDHAAVSARIFPATLRRGAAPDPARRRAALEKIDAALARMTSLMLERERARSWIPIYGFLITTRYHHQLEQLYDIRQRVETARILTLGSDAHRFTDASNPAP